MGKGKRKKRQSKSKNKAPSDLSPEEQLVISAYSATQDSENVGLTEDVPFAIAVENLSAGNETLDPTQGSTALRYDNFSTEGNQASTWAERVLAAVAKGQGVNEGEEESGGLNIVPNNNGFLVIPLSRSDRNEAAPMIFGALQDKIRDVYEERLSQEGTCVVDDIAVNWHRAFVPYHLDFRIKGGNGMQCGHLLSVKNKKAKDPAAYVDELAPLAKQFFGNPQNIDPSHLPFYQLVLKGKNSGPTSAEQEKKERQTVSHAQQLMNKQQTLENSGSGANLQKTVQTAEATAQLINRGEILYDYLQHLLTTPTRENTKITPKMKQSADQAHGPAAPNLDEATSSGTPVPEQPPASVNTDAGRKKSSKKKKKRQKPGSELKAAVIPEGNSEAESTGALVPPEIEGVEVDLAHETSFKSDQPPSLDADPGATILTNTSEKATRKSSPHELHSSQKMTNAQTQDTTEEKEGNENAILAPLSKAESAEPANNKDDVSQSHGMATKTELPSIAGLSISTDDVSKTQPVDSNAKDFWANLLSAKRAGVKILQQSVANTVSPQELPSELNWGLSPQEYKANRFGNQHDSQPSLFYGYYTDPVADQKARAAGTMLFQKPPGYHQHQPNRYSRSSGGTTLAPAVIRRDVECEDGPVVEFDGEVVEIIPRAEPWADIRSNPRHPDYLVPYKLAEYQACEDSGFRVWRHSFDTLKCRAEGCTKTLRDTCSSTVLCLGCGPKTVIRYCSLEHQLQAMETHWQECGSAELVMERIIDEDTEPEWLEEEFPAIRERHGVKAWALHRQLLLTIVCGGHYTLFHPVTQHPAVLFWPKQKVNWKEIDARIERLINIACFDISQHKLIGYLFRLLHTLIKVSNAGLDEVRFQALRNQFLWEFNFDASGVGESALCECEWLGVHMKAGKHQPACGMKKAPSSRLRESFGDGLEMQVKEMESRFWILRAWQQQNDVVKDWRDRLMGIGFKKPVHGGEEREFGPGWNGWGAPADDICA